MDATRSEPMASPLAPLLTEPKAEPTLAPASAPTPPRARIVVVPRDGQEAGRAPASTQVQAALPSLAPNTLPPHDWEAIERRRKLAQRRAAESGKRLHAFEERRQAHLETLKKEVLRAEAVEVPLQPTFFTPAKTRGSSTGGGVDSRRSSFGDRLCPPKEHYHQRSQSRERQSEQLDLRGCTFQPVIFTRSQRQQQQKQKHHGKRGGSGERSPAGSSSHHKDDESVSSLSSGSTAGNGSGQGGGPSVFERNHEFGQIYKMRREKRREELRKQEAESLPFTPQMLSRASSPGPQQPPAPVTAKDREAFFERIKIRLSALEERKQRDKEEWELRGCSFQPKTNNRHRQQHTAGGMPFYERLYNQAHARRLSLEELKRRYEGEERRECTFDPFLLKQALGPDAHFEDAVSVVAASLGATHLASRPPRQRAASTPSAPLLAAASPSTTSTPAHKATTIHDLLGPGAGPAAIVIKGGAVAVKPPTPLAGSASAAEPPAVMGEREGEGEEAQLVDAVEA